MKFLGISVAAIEWFDNAIFIALTDIISQIFFPEYDLQARFMLYFGSIALGYLGRPLGAFLFGLYSDKKNRIKAAYLAFILMVCASLIISFLPGYNSIGFLAPILFITLRFLQGIAIGGNYGVSIVTVENAHKSERYFSSSLISVGIMLGFLLGSSAASILHAMFTHEFLLSFGWRIGLWCSALLALPIFFNFRKIDMQVVDKKEKIMSTKLNWMQIFKVFILFLLDMVPFYLLFTFLPNYKIMFLGQNPTQIWFNNSISMIMIIICTPFFGKLADMYGAIRILKFASLSFVAISFFGPWMHWIWSVVFGVVMSMCYGSLYGFIALIFPENIRARVSGVLFNLTASISIGLTPIIATYLVQFSFYYVCLFLALVCVNIWAVLNTLPEH